MGSDLLAHAKRRGYGRAERVSRRQSLAPASRVNEVKTAAGEKEGKICRARAGSRAISHVLVNRIYLINDQHGDRRVDQGIQNRVGDYGVVQRPRGETFKQQSDHDARADREQITDDNKGYRVTTLKSLVGSTGRARH